MSDLQVLEDLRELLVRQGSQMAEMVTSIRGLDVRPVVEVQAAGLTTPSVDSGEIAAAVAMAISPLLAAVDQAVAGLAEAAKQVAESSAKREPVTIRGGGMSADTLAAAISGTVVNSRPSRTDEARFDPADRADGQPVYVGEALQGTTTSAAIWVIRKIEYDGSGHPSRIQVKTGSWDNRATLF